MNNSVKVVFPKCLVEPVLELIRHYNQPLESLVNHIKNQLLESLLPGELVQFNLSQNSVKSIQGKIVKREVNSIQQCHLSSSKNGAATTTDSSVGKLPSPAKIKKAVYSVKLLDKNEVVTGVLGSDLRRCGYIPSKCAIRTFIFHAGAKYEGTETGRWVIDDSNLKKLSVINPEKELISKPGFKRKLNCSSDCNSKNLPESGKKTGDSETKVKRRKTKKTQQNRKLTLSPVWAKVLKNASLEPEVVLVRLEESQSKMCIDDQNKNATLIGNASDVVAEKENRKVMKSPIPTKKMKQMTLFDMTKKMSSPHNACVSSATETTQIAANGSPTDNTALLNLGASTEKPVVILDAFHKNNVLGDSQRYPESDSLSSKKMRGPKNLKNGFKALTKSKKDPMVLNRANHIFVIRSTEGDGSANGLQKDIQTKGITKNENKLLVIDFNERNKGLALSNIENSLKLLQLPKMSQIPAPKLIKTPVGFENHWFGDAAMVIQFVSSFRGILLPNKSVTLSIDSLIEAVVSGPKGFAYFGNLLMCLLRTFVEGADSDEYEVAGVSLQDIPINIYTVSEMTRLCLSSEKEDLGSSSVAVPEVVLSLANKEIFQLDPYSILSLMCALCMKLLDCPKVQNYVDEKRNEASKLRSERLQIFIQKKNAMRLEKENLKVEIPEQNEHTSEPLVQKSTELNPGDFYGVVSTGDSLEADLILAKQNRTVLAEKVQKERQMAIQMEREREIKDAEELKQRKEEELLLIKLQTAEELDSALRKTKPLGVDRHSSRYWFFSHFTPKFVIEKGWLLDMDNSDPVAVSNCEKNSKMPSCKIKNQWFTYENEREIKKLISSLSSDYPEKSLKFQLKKHLSKIVQSLESSNASKNNLQIVDASGDNIDLKNDLQIVDASANNIDIVVALREEIIKVESRIVEGALGQMEDRDAWLVKVIEANTCKDFASCLKSLQESLNHRFACGAFALKAKASKDAKLTGVDVWKRMLDTCTTMSGMHVLLGVLTACIDWERSSANQKCRVCRKLRAGSEGRLLLCDECNLGFHLSCLRPPLTKIPSEDWFCPACQKSQEENRKASEIGESEDEDDGDEKEESRDSEEESEDEETEDDSTDDSGGSCNSDFLEGLAKQPCVKCQQKGDDLVVCPKCYRCFHKACHKPPLRNYPRGHWICYRCQAYVERSRRVLRNESCKKQSRRSLSRSQRSQRSVSRTRQSPKSASRKRRSVRLNLSSDLGSRRRCLRSSC